MNFEINSGLGTTAEQQQLTKIGASVASVGAPIGVAVATSTGLITASTAGAIVPFIGPAIVGITLLIGLFTKRGAQKEGTTKIVNDAEPLLKQNLQAWNSSSKTVAEQQQALSNFNAVWQQVVASCDIDAYGAPGDWCVNDRKRGGKWDWFSYYYDPIANDPNVQKGTAEGIFSSTGSNSSISSWLVIGLGVAAIVWAMD
jgi:hypothetical protein